MPLAAPSDAALTLLADIGGTNTRVALADGAVLRPDTIRRYANAGHAALWPILAEYLTAGGSPRIGRACICAAGPVSAGKVTLTNLAWEISEAELAARTGVRDAAVLNDLAAQGHALDALAPGALRPVLPGQPVSAPDATRLVIGIGTGFNAAPVHRIGRGCFVPASEAGHVTLPVTDAETLRLHDFIARRSGFADVEEVLSGRGVALCHAFVCAEAGRGTPLDPAGVLAGIGAGDPLAEAAGRLFVRVLATVTGDLALTHLPHGGIHLIGGVARAIAPWLGRFGFATAFHARGRFAALVRDFPICVVEDDYAALAGCAIYLDRLCKDRPASSQN
ncbi:glucokinase [Paenirhodobacter enshiensis]|uniref:Glucokinase n=1 Tax=Paenirhodobacter enshiensis TaxID=1105367 RepID=A0A086XYV6_9RHOB|nr:glucokinase [Paenirhodobacter enshiensis]KFI27206.1 hypothetical protein CG50_00185 [Paenirhodobacter enshiensis]